MCIDNEIINAINFYAVLKKDLHTLLVEGSKSPIDYIGEIEVHPYFTEFTYPIEERKSREVYDAMVSISSLIENMLKDDIRLWGKTQNIKWIQVAPDHRCETVVMEIGFME